MSDAKLLSSPMSDANLLSSPVGNGNLLSSPLGNGNLLSYPLGNGHLLSSPLSDANLLSSPLGDARALPRVGAIAVEIALPVFVEPLERRRHVSEGRQLTPARLQLAASGYSVTFASPRHLRADALFGPIAVRVEVVTKFGPIAVRVGIVNRIWTNHSLS